MRLLPGTVLKGRYQVDELVAEGGTSVIYRGHPLHGAGEVAIKQMQEVADAREHAENLRLFQREHELLSDLRHAALPHVLDLFEDGGVHYLVEEFVRGESLQAVLERDRRLPWPRALEIGLAVLDALSFLHEHGIIYRDLKPANILIATSGSARLIDFGAARRYVPGRAHDTVPLGTPGYASPEQYGRAQTDARSDVFGLGVVMHHMLTGIDPTEREAWLFAPPRSVVADIPVGLNDLVMQAIELDPSNRLATAPAMRDSLAALDVPTLGALRARLQYTRHEDYVAGGYDGPGGPGCGPAVPTDFLIIVPVFLVLYGIGRLIWSVEVSGRHRRYENLAVEIYDRGLRVIDGSTRELMWTDLRRMSVTYTQADSVYRAKLVSDSGTISFNDDWPGVDAMVEEILDAADLEEAHTKRGVVEYVRRV